MEDLINNPNDVRPIHLGDFDVEGEQKNLYHEDLIEPMDSTELPDDENDSKKEKKNSKPDGCLFKPIVVDEEEVMLNHARSLSFEQRIVFDKIVKFCKSVLRSYNGADIVPNPPKIIVTGKNFFFLFKGIEFYFPLVLKLF